MTQKIVRAMQAMQNETVRIRWFLPLEGGFYDEEYTCPPKEVRNAREAERAKSSSRELSTETEKSID